LVISYRSFSQKSLMPPSWGQVPEKLDASILGADTRKAWCLHPGGRYPITNQYVTTSQMTVNFINNAVKTGVTQRYKISVQNMCWQTCKTSGKRVSTFGLLWKNYEVWSCQTERIGNYPK